ncbi:MAG: hypothetical protein KA956_02010 [Pyrinomonadaceae bacterium]|nr:hypothetical protein [Acidobacteriota bacterium]MBP7375231.1 hypothetical protein [Pyrinomonadaceae bacterium]
MARKNLVDGSKAYKDRKFPEAERLFRYAASLDPNGDTVEGRTAQLSLARTLHSMFIGDRQNKAKAEEALAEYNKSLPQSLKDLKEVTAVYEKNKADVDSQRKYFNTLSALNSTTSAIASLYENLTQPEKAREWQVQVANNAEMPATARARALSSLASKANSCANEISDTEATKKTVQKDGKDVFQFTKPANADDFAKLKQCVDEGTKLIDQAVALEPDEVKNAATFDITGASDPQLQLNSEIMKVFESTRSYKASLTIQAMRIAEMDGNNAERDRLKAEGDALKAKFTQLSDVVKKLQAEIEARIAAKEEAEKTEAQKQADASKNTNK